MAINFSKLNDDRTVDGSIRNRVNYSLVPVADHVLEIEGEIYKRLRVREMLATVNGLMSIGDDTIEIPDRFRAVYTLDFTGTYKARLTPRPLDVVEGAFEYDANGDRINRKPRIYAPTQEAIQFDAQADLAYSYQMRYFQALEGLSEANETNFLTDRYPSLLIHGLMYKAYEHMRRPAERTYHLQMFEKQIFEANQQFDLESLGIEINVEVV